MMKSADHTKPDGSPESVCAGLRVLDFSWGMAGPLVGMVLADYGAEVIKIEPPGGGPFRAMPGAVQWHRGKKSVVLDLKEPAQREQAQRLAAAADIVIESFRPGVADRLGIGYATLSRSNPGLVYCSISGFGQQGPWSAIKGYEGVVLARGGLLAATKVGWRTPGPVYIALMQGSNGAANFALHGIFGALRLHLQTGRGYHVQTSLLQGSIAFQINTTYQWKEPSHSSPPPAPDDARDPLCNLPGYRICRCADGKWLQLGVFQSDIFHRMMLALGMPEESKDPRNATAPQFRNDADRKRMIRRLEEQIAQKPFGHWAQALEKHDVPFAPHLTTQEAMDDVHVRHLGLVVPVADPNLGPTEQVGPPFVLHEGNWSIKGPAPATGQHTQEVLKELGSGNGRVKAADAPSPSAKPMLAGVKVIEVATYVAAPTAMGYLVDYGAEVIKVEPPNGDPQNSWGDVNTRPNRGKRSIRLDLKDPKHQEALHHLAADADVFLHNFRPGVAERLRIDYPTMSKVNPRLVYCHAASYGSTGPYARRGAFDPVISALMGGTVAQAGQGNPPSTHMTSDLGAGVTTASAIMMALYHRDRTGRGQQIETRMLNAAAYLHSDDFLRYSGKPPRRIADKRQHGLSALYRLYQAGAGWVFCAVVTDAEWRAFCGAIGKRQWLTDERFATAGSRAAHDEALAKELASLFMTRPAEEWERLLTAADVACVRAHEDFGAIVFTDKHMLQAVGVTTGTHPTLGEFTQVGPLVRLGGVPVVTKLKTSSSGQDTAEVLRSLGYASELKQGEAAVG